MHGKLFKQNEGTPSGGEHDFPNDKTRKYIISLTVWHPQGINVASPHGESSSSSRKRSTMQVSYWEPWRANEILKEKNKSQEKEDRG